MSSGTCWHCEADHDTGDCPTRKQWTKGEHQPGSPGVDLDALERRLELDLGSWGNLNTYRRVFAELRTLRARVESYAMDLAALEGTNAANEGALRIQLERLHGERSRAEAAEARVKELEDRAAGYLHAFKDGCERSIEAVAALEARITDLESQLAAAREEQGLEAKVREVLGERFFQVRIARYHEFWQAEWREVVRGETLERFADAETLPALLRAILAVEKGGPDEG